MEVRENTGQYITRGMCLRNKKNASDIVTGKRWPKHVKFITKSLLHWSPELHVHVYVTSDMMVAHPDPKTEPLEI